MKQVIAILFLLWAATVAAQSNLVPNASFEEFTQCPHNRGQIVFVEHWGKFGGNGVVEYFHECGINCCGVFDNIYGGQSPRTGDAFISFTMMHNNHVIPGLQGAFTGVFLADTLKAGYKYDVAFYLSLCDSSRFASRNAGLHVSKGQPNSDIDSLLSIVPEVRYEGPFLTDKEDWMKIEGSFFAQGGENYLTIGNFDGAESSDTLNLHEGGMDPDEGYWEVAYYFLDDVSVVEDTSYHVGIENQLAIGNGQLSIYPNPAKNLLTVLMVLGHKQAGTIELMNYLGHRIQTTPLNNGITEIDVSSLSSGVYHYSIHVDGVLRQTGKQVILK